MIQLAAANRGMAKLVVIGQSGKGQDIVALKVTKNARNVADGSRPGMLFSAVNHAREWIAADVGRRMPITRGKANVRVVVPVGKTIRTKTR